MIVHTLVKPGGVFKAYADIDGPFSGPFTAKYRVTMDLYCPDHVYHEQRTVWCTSRISAEKTVALALGNFADTVEQQMPPEVTP